MAVNSACLLSLSEGWRMVGLSAEVLLMQLVVVCELALACLQAI